MQINAADTAFMLTATALVLIMTIGAIARLGLNKRRNAWLRSGENHDERCGS